VFYQSHRKDYELGNLEAEPTEKPWSPEVTPGKLMRTFERYAPPVQLQVAAGAQSVGTSDDSFTPVSRDTLAQIDDLLAQVGVNPQQDVPTYEVITGTTAAENSRSEMSFRAEPRWRQRTVEFDEGVRRDAQRRHRRDEPHPTQSPAAPEQQRLAMTPNWGLMLAVNNYERWHDLPQVRRFLRAGSSFRRSFGVGLDHVEPPPRDPTGQEMHNAIFNAIWAMSMQVRPDDVGHLVIYISGHGGSNGVFGSDDREGPSVTEPDLRRYADLAREQNIHVTYIIESCKIGLMVTHAQVAVIFPNIPPSSCASAAAGKGVLNIS